MCKGIEELKQKLATHAAELPQMGELFSKRWKHVRDTLAAMDQPRLPFSEFVALCEQQGIDDHEAHDALADLLHDLGAIVYYQILKGLKNIDFSILA